MPQMLMQRLDDPGIGRREGIVGQFLGLDPAHLLTSEGLRVSRCPTAEMDDKAQFLVQ